jgi:O-antigen/teichoic acid export membrane protein
MAVVALWPRVHRRQAAAPILMGCQFARAVFGPSVPLLTVIVAQRQNSALAIAALIVLGMRNLILAPRYGVLGAAIAVAIATLFWWWHAPLCSGA